VIAYILRHPPVIIISCAPIPTATDPPTQLHQFHAVSRQLDTLSPHWQQSISQINVVRGGSADDGSRARKLRFDNRRCTKPPRSLRLELAFKDHVSVQSFSILHEEIAMAIETSCKATILPLTPLFGEAPQSDPKLAASFDPRPVAGVG
jgi:hypothetical protein